jgi:DNA-binding GntR family transcriptional regulator
LQDAPRFNAKDLLTVNSLQRMEVADLIGSFGNVEISLDLAPANRTLLVDQVTLAVRSAIIDGSLTPGTRLVETELAETFKVSRGPVREALRRLEKEGLVRIVPAGGTFVASLTERDIADIYGLRAAVEGYAARAAASVNANLHVLEESLQQIQASVHAEKLSGLIEADVVFHRSLIALAQNRRLLAVWKDLEGQMRLILSLTRDQVYRDPPRLTEQHRSLVNAIQSRDGDLAERCVREHIQGRIGERLAYLREMGSRASGGSSSQGEGADL